ncbi:MAG: hypothetical protein AAFR01_08915, partial [Pseudomonadota bacterium]
MTARQQCSDWMLQTKKLGRLIPATAAVLTISACGGGGDDTPTPVATNNAPSVSADALLLSAVSDGVALTATGSDPDGDTLSYTWTQTRGGSVSNPAGEDSASFSFNAPADVDTLVFSVSVSDGSLSASTEVQVIVLEDIDDAVFIDGAFAGANPDGSIDAPFTSLRDAAEAGTDTTDYYIKTLPNDESYDISGNDPFDRLVLRSNSLYGGYDDSWLRDVENNRTRIVAGIRALYFNDFGQPVTVSGLDITGGDIDTNTSSEHAILIDATFSAESFRVLSNTLTASNAETATFRNSNANSIAL